MSTKVPWRGKADAKGSSYSGPLVRALISLVPAMEGAPNVATSPAVGCVALEIELVTARMVAHHAAADRGVGTAMMLSVCF